MKTRITRLADDATDDEIVTWALDRARALLAKHAKDTRRTPNARDARSAVAMRLEGIIERRQREQATRAEA